MNQDSAAFLRAVKGPVMMITLGVLFALDGFTPLPFSRTWPVLLVVGGILSLGGRAAPMQGRIRYRAQWGPPRPPVPPPPPPSPFTQPPQATWTPSGTSTTPPGSYRGSAYQATPGSTSERGSENKEKKERPVTPDPGATP
jgi:hypothetical protein